LEIFADESEGNDGLKMKKTRVSFHPSQTSHGSPLPPSFSGSPPIDTAPFQVLSWPILAYFVQHLVLLVILTYSCWLFYCCSTYCPLRSEKCK
jgi:hypothetical protein